MKSKFYIYQIIFCFFIFDKATNAQSCETQELVHYSFQDIKIILDKNNCNSCHFKGSTNNLWSYDSYVDMNVLGNCGESIINHGNPWESLLVDKLNGGSSKCGLPMPIAAQSISSKDLLSIETWILVGAPEFCIPTYKEIKEIFDIHACEACHYNSDTWQFDNYSNMFVKPKASFCNTPIIVPFNANNSLIYKKLSGKQGTCGNAMPLDKAPLSYYEIAKIRDWINAGATEKAKILPVVLTDFSAMNIKDQFVDLSWQSSSEINTDYYEIQHSLDGYNFKAIDKLAAKNNHNMLVQYEFTHFQFVVGYNYYRLKIVDFDEQFSYSPTRAIRISNVDEIFKIYPTILRNDKLVLNLEWYPIAESEKIRLALMDINGKLAFSTILDQGLNILDLPFISSGVYYAVIKNYDNTSNIKKIIILD